MSKKIDKETALKYFNHLKNCKGYSSKEVAMKEALEDDDNFSLIESEFLKEIEETRAKLPAARLKNVDTRLAHGFEDQYEYDDEDETEEVDESIGFHELFKKLLNNREFNDYDYDNIVLEQRVSFDDVADEYVGDPKGVELDVVLRRLEKIKAKFPGQKIHLNTIASGTMSVDRIRVHAVIKKLRPLFTVYYEVLNIIKGELQQHQYDIENFNRKKKELGL